MPNDMTDRLDKVLDELDEAVAHLPINPRMDVDDWGDAGRPVLRRFAASLVEDCAGKARNCLLPISQRGLLVVQVREVIANKLHTFAEEIRDAK